MFSDTVTLNPEVDQQFRKKTAQAIRCPSTDYLNDTTLYQMAKTLTAFSEQMAGFSFYPYQRDFSTAIAFSLLRETGDEITALWARQIGKTESVAVTIMGLVTLLPSLGHMFAHDERLRKFKNGLWVGIFGPNKERSAVMYNRVHRRITSKAARQTLADPELNLTMPTTGKRVELSNGSYVNCRSANTRAVIEGDTYHLLILEEAQYISDQKVLREIQPMGASTAATLVKIGTPVSFACEFERACSRNVNRDQSTKSHFPGMQNHYQFDYKIGMKYNPRYAKYIKKELERNDYDSDEFRMSYRLHWIGERGHFVTDTQLRECGIHTKQTPLSIKLKDRASRTGWTTHVFNRPAGVVTHDVGTTNQIAAIDFGKAASTVVTVARVWWDNPIELTEGERRYYTHIQNWLELQGDDYEAQMPQMLDFLKNYNIGYLVCDATGVGDPLYSRITALVSNYDITVIPFVFSEKSKDIGYKLFLQELRTHRFTYPDSKGARKLKKQRKFAQQMVDLEKTWRGSKMVVHKAHTRGARDDYPDSAMMMVWGTTSMSSRSNEAEVEEENIFFGRQRKRNQRSERLRDRGWARRGRASALRRN